MKDNEAYVITIKSGVDEYYASHRGGVTSKLKHAIFFSDEEHAKHELRSLLFFYGQSNGDHFFNGKYETLIRKVEINFI